MKALLVDAPGEAKVVEIPEPVVAPGQVLLQVRMVGLCGTDLNTFRGRNPLVQFPVVIGHEVAATLLEPAAISDGVTLFTGTNVTLSPYTACGQCASCLRGRRNACQFNQTYGVQRHGAMTERIAEFPERLYPANLSIKEFAMVEPLTIGFHAVARGEVTSDDIVAVIGCGGVGLGAISGAAARGARTIAIDVDDAKLELARKTGATDTINTSREDLHKRLSILTDWRGPDCIIEAIGLPATFRAAVEEVAFTGRVVYIGYAKEAVAYETRLFVQKELDIRGSRNALPEDFRAVIKMLEGGHFPTDDAVSVIVPIEDTPEILKRWSEEPAAFSKIMVQIS